MDYKSLVQQFNKLDSEITSYIKDRTQRNMLRGNSIVEDYYESLRNNEYSIKSFKAKIIQNEMEHRRTTEDFNKMVDASYLKVDEIVDKCFDNYLESLKDLNLSVTKIQDLRDYKLLKKRSRQDVINRINSSNKDFQQQLNLDKEELKAKIKEQNDLIGIENRKLKIDLNKLNEQVLKSYSKTELELLNCDDKNEIRKFKEEIKSKRFEGLNQEYEIKMKAYLDLKNKKEAFENEIKEFKLSECKKNYNVKLQAAQYQLQIKEIELQLEGRDLEYDFEYKKKRYDLIRNSKLIFVSLAKNHNNLLYKYELSKFDYESEIKFLIAFVLIKLYQIQIALCEQNIFDPMIIFIENILAMNKTNNEEYENIVKTIKKDLSNGIDKLKLGLHDISLAAKARVSKDELEENVISSIERYYNNITAEVSFFNESLLGIFAYFIKKFGDKYFEITGKNLFVNDKYLFMNSNYGYDSFNGFGYKEYEFGNENNQGLEEYYNQLINDLNEFSYNIEPTYDRQILSMSKDEKELEKKMLKKYDEAKTNYQKMVNDYLKVYNKEVTKVNNEYLKNIKLIEQEYQKDCDKERNNLRKNISIL